LPRHLPDRSAAIGLALDRLGSDGDSVQPLFITVDPERDTRSILPNMSRCSIRA
jgi:protein SCO1/2